MCFKPKVSTPQASSIPLPEKIYAPAVVSGVQYGGMNDTASGNADATVDTT
ncbi:putative phage head protein, partial [Kocuria sp. CPCC 205274]